MNTILEVHPQNLAQLNALKTLMETFKVPFTEMEVNENDTVNYDPQFVKMLLDGKQDIVDGKGETIAIEDLWL